MSDNAVGIMKKGGVILAKVTNITDPDKLNRLKCKPITEDPDVGETDWCYCIAPMAGKAYGMFFFPQVDDLVLLGYLGGDVHHPIVFGSYWANDVTAPYTIEDGKNNIRSIKTPAGTEIKLDDEADKQKVTITTPLGATLSVSDEAKSIEVKDPKGENMLTIAWEAGEVTLSAKTKLTLKAGDTTLTLESSGNITGNGSATVSVKGMDVEVKADNGAKFGGTQVDVEAQGVLNVKASGNTVIKGALVQIN